MGVCFGHPECLSVWVVGLGVILAAGARDNRENREREREGEKTWLHIYSIPPLHNAQSTRTVPLEDNALSGLWVWEQTVLGLKELFWPCTLFFAFSFIAARKFIAVPWRSSDALKSPSFLFCWNANRPPSPLVMTRLQYLGAYQRSGALQIFFFFGVFRV